MRASNRDLLVLVKDELLSSDSMEMELEKIHQLLVDFETPSNFCMAHEIFDINRHKIIASSITIQKIMCEKELKAFVFVINKN